MRRFRPLVCTLALYACGDEDETTPEPEPPVDAGSPTPDAAPPVEVDAGPAPGIPLIEWVDDLLDHHTNDTSAPDTVDDKKIIDDEDPNKFNGRF
jgi:hypothetical protein